MIALGALFFFNGIFTWQIILEQLKQFPAFQEIINPIRLWASIIFMVIEVAAYLVAGVFLLRGADWSRWLYMGWTGIAMLIGLFASPISPMHRPNLPMFLLNLLLCGVGVFFLFRPAANAYFTLLKKAGEALTPPAQP